MVNAGGWRVEKAIRTFGDRVPVAWLRISWQGYWQADCLTTAEVAEYVDLSTLVPEAPHRYVRAVVKAPWRPASEQFDALEKATAQSHELAKTRVDVAGSQRQLRVVPDSRPLRERQAPRSTDSSNVKPENPPAILRSG
jgi:hypothetical protein